MEGLAGTRPSENSDGKTPSEPVRDRPDESGRVFLGGLLASIARFRFPGKAVKAGASAESDAGTNTDRTDRSAMPEKTHCDAADRYFTSGLAGTAAGFALAASR